MAILIIGATGNIGRHLADTLLESRQQLLLGVRETEKAKAIWKYRASYTHFDFDEPETFEPALSRVERCFFIAPHNDPVPSVELFLQHARHLKQLTFSSGRTTGGIEGKPLNTIEQKIWDSFIPATILRPGWFMQNFTGWIGDDIRSERKIVLPAGDSKTAFIDVRDIAEVAALTLIHGGHTGHTYELVSDEAFDHFEVAKMIAKAIGETVEYQPMAPLDYIKRMMKKGWSRDVAEHTVELYRLVMEGREEEVTTDVEEVLARKPRRLKDFIGEHKDEFQ
ncbi:MAG: NmrA family NAD(P)-binding protein [Lewinellaceae bacterium]|nr:NmrA family NAD(P)-binding protein [Lewinellaceae bacterium]